ncbi:MAG: peroxiredoxin [Deltaproteobacteria bacterium]|nr:peroxiredoxin [Deltaproteobacteria bacterium]
MEAQERQPIPRINDPAPDFKAISTHGEITLSQFTKAGKWVLLFSHPADFTPVCTTEFVEFSRLAPEFEKRNVQLVGLSVDSIYSHLGWEQNIEKNFGQKVPFPVIADRNTQVAQLYGLIHPGASDTATVRAVFVIDPKGMVRALIYYPLQSGRHSDEILRLIDALQAVDKNAIATPVNWRPGEEVIVPPPVSETALRERLEMGKKGEVNQTDWYFSKKKI